MVFNFQRFTSEGGGGDGKLTPYARNSAENTVSLIGAGNLLKQKSLQLLNVKQKIAIYISPIDTNIKNP